MMNGAHTADNEMSTTTIAWANYLISLLSGSIGGAGAASWHVLSGRHAKWQHLISYVIVGGSVGLFVGAWLHIYSVLVDLPGDIRHHLVAVGIGSGFMAVTVLVGMRKIACVVLKWHGINVEIKFNRRSEDRQDD